MNPQLDTEFYKNSRANDGLAYQCKSCERIYAAQWRSENKAELAAYHKEYRAENVDRLVVYIADYQQRNKERLAAYHAEYYKNNPPVVDPIKRAQNQASWKAANPNYHIEYNRKNPGYIRAKNARYRARIAQAVPKWLTEEHWLAIFKIYQECDAITKATGVSHHVDHMLPVSGKEVSGLHVPWNLRIITGVANIKKGNRLVDVDPTQIVAEAWPIQKAAAS